jgi:hypothetical protein
MMGATVPPVAAASTRGKSRIPSKPHRHALPGLDGPARLQQLPHDGVVSRGRDLADVHRGVLRGKAARRPWLWPRCRGGRGMSVRPNLKAGLPLRLPACLADCSPIGGDWSSGMTVLTRKHVPCPGCGRRTGCPAGRSGGGRMSGGRKPAHHTTCVSRERPAESGFCSARLPLAVRPQGVCKRVIQGRAHLAAASCRDASCPAAASCLAAACPCTWAAGSQAAAAGSRPAVAAA